MCFTVKVDSIFVKGQCGSTLIVLDFKIKLEAK